MDAISHPETGAHVRSFRGAGLAKTGITAAKPAVLESRGLSLHEMKRMAMNAIKHADTVAQAGVVRLGVSAAVYAAHMGQVERDAKRDTQRETFPRPLGRPQRSVGHDFGRE
jgi:hypothetical protein